MPDITWDLETRSAASLRLVGPWNYAAHPTTEMLCLCYAVDNGEVQTWVNQSLLGAPAEPPPEPFLAAASDPTNWRVIAHNYEFERAILEHVLIPRHGFPSISLEAQHCSMALALANAYPAELETLAKALELPYQKDREGLVLMRQMSRPRKARKGEDKNILHWVFDAEKLARLVGYCASDVRATRAAWQHPKLKPLNADERRYQILDAIINRRGVRADRELATMARDLALRERNAINSALKEFTAGEITSVDQVGRILAYAVDRGHAMTSVSRRSVSAVLAAEPDEETQKVLELRRDGARASVRKYERILAYAGTDDRMRGTLRMYGGAPGRWSGRGPQLQNLKKNEGNLPFAVVDAVRTGDREAVRPYGNLLTVLADIARSTVCADRDLVLMAGDLAAIESRILAWFSGEQWKLEAYREFDRTNDKSKEPYRVVAAKMLQKNDPAGLSREERNKGKAGDLACGFGGSVGAWRRIVPDDKRSDPEILHDIRAWRDAHPRTTDYWRELARAIRIAIRTGQPFTAGRIVASFENGNLYLALPSRRQIVYPQARLVESNKFEGAPPDVMFKDNARGKWSDYRGWFGTFVENVVQGTARDLLAAAIERFEARNIPIVLTVHDEIVAEVPAESISESEFLAILLEPPQWAAGLPLAGKVWSGPHYLEPPEEAPAPAVDQREETELERLIEPHRDDDDDAVLPARTEQDDAELLTDLDDADAPLFELVSVPLTESYTTQCPFHPDEEPSLKFYADHFHCFGCGEHGDRIDWLTRGEGLSREEAIALIRDWDGPATPRRPQSEQSKIAHALQLWAQAVPIAGTLAERYLAETRRIDLAGLPANSSDTLRFLARCPFGVGTPRPCLLALMRDAETDQPVGIQRIALELREGRVCKLDRFALGRLGAVRLWPAERQLVIGEGLETTLAAATRIPYRGAPLRPAWSAVSSGKVSTFPVLPGVEQLIILVDHDGNGEGQAAAVRCMERWTRAGRRVVRLTPKRTGADFNDLIMPEVTP